MIDRNLIGVGVVVLVVIVSICVIYFANRADEQDKLAQELNKYSHLDESDDKLPECTGGSTEKYSWDQNEEAVDVSIPLTKFDPPPTVREIDVSFKARYLKVTIRREVYLEGYFHDKVNAEDCCWTLERDIDNTILALSLIKAQSSDSDLWPCLLDGEPHINLPRKRMPSIETLNPSDPTAVKRAMAALKK